MTARGSGKTDAALVEFLRARRWFGDKGHELRGLRVVDTIPVEWPAAQGRFGVSRVEVSTDAGTSTYQLFSPLNEQGAPQLDTDALGDAGFRRGLADAFTVGATFERAGTRWVLESETRAALVVPADGSVTLNPAEQTNSSLVLNRQGILKLFRRIEPGIHPDVEVTRFLTVERQFTHVPALLGSVRFEDADGTTVAGMLQEYVQGATDAWAVALDAVKRKAPFTIEAERLGVVIRALHEALASGEPGTAFDHQQATAGDVQSWQAGARKTITRALAALDRAVAQRRLPSESENSAKHLAERGPVVLRRVEALSVRLRSDAGAATRIHGDLHLGQILRAATGAFLVIDFEGEPARPLAERRVRSSPLRDVAGMLRSFSYAASNGEAADAWEGEVRAAFLRGYFAASSQRQAALFPRERDNTDALVNLFEIEKAFYELQYELDHRPDWAWIPLRTLERLAV